MSEDSFDNSMFNEKFAKANGEMKKILDKQQEKINDLYAKTFTVKNRGVIISMFGNYRLEKVEITQDFFETSSKSVLEKSIYNAYLSLYDTIRNELEDISNQTRDLMNEVVNEARLNDGTDKDN